MDSTIVQQLYRHASWANRRLFDTLAPLEAEFYLGLPHPSYETVHAALVHLVDVEQGWLAVAQALPDPGILSVADLPDLATVRAAWEQVDAATLAFVNGLDAAEIVAPVALGQNDGASTLTPRWQILLHQVQHAAQHRAEIALLLAERGVSTGDLDYFDYRDSAGDV